MGQIIIVTGPFSSGKTEMANEVVRQLGGEDRVLRVADGLHLVNIVRDDVHGLGGRTASCSHFHSWNDQSPWEPHHHTDGSGHFPFTVLEPWVGPEMFRRVIKEMVEKAEGELPVVVELGVGGNGCRFSKADFSTAAFLRELEQTDFGQALVENIACVIGIESEWGKRIERNQGRVEVADGVTASWGMQEEGLRITYDTDFQAWQEAGINLLTYNNNGDGVEGMKSFVEGIVLPKIQGEEGKPRGRERLY
jgi:hypothetical protein